MKRTILIFIFVLLISPLNSAAGNIRLPEDSTKCLSKFDTLLNRQVFVFVDTMPQFPGGMKAMFKFISLNLNYPREADCIEGTVLVKLVVESNGDLSRKKVLNSFYEPASEEALRVINKMPK